MTRKVRVKTKARAILSFLNCRSKTFFLITYIRTCFWQWFCAHNKLPHKTTEICTFVCVKQFLSVSRFFLQIFSFFGATNTYSTSSNQITCAAALFVVCVRIMQNLKFRIKVKDIKIWEKSKRALSKFKVAHVEHVGALIHGAAGAKKLPRNHLSLHTRTRQCRRRRSCRCGTCALCTTCS